jgi:protein-L-isoaspartate O-methyltransferase
MGFYARRIFPFLVDRALRNEDAAACRERIVPLARGQVLEIGIGSGLNLPFYGPAVETVIGVDPSLELLTMARNRAGGRGAPLRLLRASADAIPLSDGTIDMVVVTWTLCSVPDPLRALEEAGASFGPTDASCSSSTVLRQKTRFRGGSGVLILCGLGSAVISTGPLTGCSRTLGSTSSP